MSTRFRPNEPTANPYGRGGNPAKRAEREAAKQQKALEESTKDLFERLVESEVPLTLGGKKTKLRAVDALFRAELQDALTGNKKERAQILRRYDALQRAKRRSKGASKRPEVMEIRLLPAEEGVLLHSAPKTKK